MILLNQITSAVLQLLIFSGVPFVWYILTQKRVKGFFKWLGISTAAAPPLNAMFCILAGFLAALFLPYIKLILVISHSASHDAVADKLTRFVQE